MNGSSGKQKRACESDDKVASRAVVGEFDPLLTLPSSVTQEGEHVILLFGDGRRIFAQCLKKRRGKAPSLKINKKTYSTAHLVGLPFGTVLELGSNGLTALPEGEGLLPEYPVSPEGSKLEASEADLQDADFPLLDQERDNRHIVDDNTSQALKQNDLIKLKESGIHGSVIVKTMINNSATFNQKTDFSKAKYVAKKQMKYQPRCRLTRCNASTICEATFLRDPKKIMNLRDDTFGQLLSYSNVSAGCQALVFETCNGLVTGGVAQRMGGYGKVFTVYTGQQPHFNEMLDRYNLTFAESCSIKWVHSGDLFAEDGASSDEAEDIEKAERDVLIWPCPLQDHTRAYLKSMDSDTAKKKFLSKRAARFARKLTRHTAEEAKVWVKARQSDALIIATRYDPTETFFKMMPYLAPSCPFVIYSEFIEPLTECFLEVQKQNVAINLRLSDTWTREYQVLPNRTHPTMSMSQSGGFLLVGTKLDPEAGKNDLDETLLKEIRAEIGGRRGKKKSRDTDEPTAQPSKRQKTVSCS